MLANNLESLSIREMDAYGLVEAAVALDLARDNAAQLALALENNLELWVAIRTLVSMSNNSLASETKENLRKLSEYIAQTTFREGATMTRSNLDSLININLQISEGLLEGARH
ncbi:MAG TPA: hypothetical protein HPQ04_13110 [Rhodospirillaceae bacterium]|nr:hypothetical protein [Rhodospirillaceae bacterium]